MDIQTQLQRGKEPVAFRIFNDCGPSSNYGHIIIDIIYVKSSMSKYDDSIGFYGNFYSEKHQYKDLRITSQMDSDYEHPYAWELAVYSSKCSTLSEAKEIVATLRPIHRKLDKIHDSEGSVDTFEEFVVRIGRALGVKAFYAKYEGNTQFQRSDSMSGLRHYLRKLITENQATLGYTKTG